MEKYLLFNTATTEDYLIKFNYERLNVGEVGWAIMSAAYQETFEILSQELISRKENNIDPSFESIIFPIIFLLRHSCEISLKEFIVNSEKILDSPHKQDLDHPLCQLWKTFSLLLSEVNSKFDIQKRLPYYNLQEIIPRIGQIILELNQIDKYSQSFRYPSKKNGEALIKGVEYIGIKNIHNKGKQVLNDLKTLHVLLTFLKQEKENSNLP